MFLTRSVLKLTLTTRFMSYGKLYEFYDCCGVKYQNFVLKPSRTYQADRKYGQYN